MRITYRDKQGNTLRVVEETHTVKTRLNTARGMLEFADKELSKEKYQDILAGDANMRPYHKPRVFNKNLIMYAIEQLENDVYIGDLLGVFGKYGLLPENAKENDIAYNETLSGFLLTKKTGIYQYINNSWILVEFIK